MPLPACPCSYELGSSEIRVAAGQAAGGEAATPGGGALPPPPAPAAAAAAAAAVAAEAPAGLAELAARVEMLQAELTRVRQEQGCPCGQALALRSLLVWQCPAHKARRNRAEQSTTEGAGVLGRAAASSLPLAPPP